MNIAHSRAIEKLKQIGQTHLLKFWNILSEEEKKKLLEQVDGIDLSLFLQLQQIALEKNQEHFSDIVPFLDYSHKGFLPDVTLGKKLIGEGRVGCIIVAGGQASRLRTNKPKGLFEVTKTGKTLLQLFAEKTLAACRQSGRELLLAIMTSPLNHNQITEHFSSNSYFGLQQHQVDFYSQEMLPFLDQEGNLFLENEGKVAEGPDGNGNALKHFVESGIWEKWTNNDVRYVTFVQVDNLLADPFDTEMIGFQARESAEIVIKSVLRKDPHEKVGVIVKKDKKVSIVEYSELPANEAYATQNNGILKHLCANISSFSFTMDFIKTASEKADEMPFHKAFKAVQFLNSNGIMELPAKPNAWKFEKFIFDVFSFAYRIKALVYPREECFAPLKNAEGPDSLETVQRALQQYDRKIFEEISGIKMENDGSEFELDPQFYYPTPELLKHWKGKYLPKEPYIGSGK